MKKLLAILLAFTIVTGAFSQAPEKMSYQAVIRNINNQLVVDQGIGIKISIYQNSPEGTLVYQEIYNPNPQTNANGLLSIEIGTGISLTGEFSEINWVDGPYFIKTETDPTGGTNYTITGSSQILSVPYALFAKTADSLNGGIIETDPVFGTWDKSTGIMINESQISDLQDYLITEIDSSITNEIQSLTLSNDTLFLSHSNYVLLQKQTPIIWSGGCTSHGKDIGWNKYCANATDFNTASDYLSVNVNGTFTVIKEGYYRINMWTISSGAGFANIQLMVNGDYKQYGHQYAGTNWIDNSMDLIWRFNTGDTFYINIYNPENYAYHSYNPSGAHSRLQVTYEGPLD
jgi:hypothetical protein